MLCSTGEPPQHPVASVKSGDVYEERLIEAYVEEDHKDSITRKELEITDLVDLGFAKTVTPSPSIPALLSISQNEWDLSALEFFTIRQQLNQARQELTTALYQHNAAVRVIARLTKERDQTRDALSKVTSSAGVAANRDAIQIDSESLSDNKETWNLDDLIGPVPAVDMELVNSDNSIGPVPALDIGVVTTTQEELSKNPRKRPVPKCWADAEATEMSISATSINPVGRHGIWKCQIGSAQSPQSGSVLSTFVLKEVERAEFQDKPIPSTFILKQFDRDEHDQFETDEYDIYLELADFQGKHIPRCYGKWSWADNTGTHLGMVLEYLEGFYTLKEKATRDESTHNKFEDALSAIGEKGVYHGDLLQINLMWNPLTEEVRVIDFEYSKSQTEAHKRDMKYGKEIGRSIPSITKQNLIDWGGVKEELDNLPV